ILNCLYGVGLLFSEDMASAFTRALNDWVAKEWLDRDPRLRASIVIPMQNTEHAVDEIERCASDRRFVQILVLAMQETPLGRRHPPRPAARHPCRLDLPALDHLARLAELLHRGLCQPHPGLPVAGGEPGLRGRVRQISRPQSGADRIRRDLAAGLSLAVLQIL